MSLLLLRPLGKLNISCLRYSSSSTRQILNDPRKILLELPEKPVDIGAMKKKTHDRRQDRRTPAEFLRHRQTMKKRFPEGWNPPRKLSREAMEGLRTLHRHDPETFSTPVLAERFRISPEAVRRILKSKWGPNKDEKANMLERERKRKQEYIAKRIEREREDKWAQVDSPLQELENLKRNKWDKLSLT
ncbi:RRG9 [Sanghuangporus sanghuang]